MKGYLNNRWINICLMITLCKTLNVSIIILSNININCFSSIIPWIQINNQGYFLDFSAVCYKTFLTNRKVSKYYLSFRFPWTLIYSSLNSESSVKFKFYLMFLKFSGLNSKLIQSFLKINEINEFIFRTFRKKE